MKLHNFNPFRTYSKKEILNSIIAFDAKYGHPPRKRDFVQCRELPSLGTTVRYFKSMNNAVLAAGLEPNPSTMRWGKSKWSDEEMIQFVREAALKIGRIPMSSEWDKYRKKHMPSRPMYYRRFVNWRTVLKRTGLKFSLIKYLLRELLNIVSEEILFLEKHLDQPVKEKK